MARNRVIYQSEALFINQDAAYSGGYNQIERVQSANYSYTINRQDINQYGQLGKLDSIIIDAPTVSADISYYLTDGFTERALGFFVSNLADTGDGSDSHVTSGSFISGHCADSSGRNLIILTTPEGTDADLPERAPTGTLNSSIGIGNCYLSDYSLDLSVGAIPTVSVSFDALNINAISTPDATGVSSPAINPINGAKLVSNQALPVAVTGYTGADGGNSIAALRPGDIVVNISTFSGSGITNIGGTGVDGSVDYDANAAHIQSASLSIPLSRSPLERLGSNNAYARSIDFPIVSTLSVSAILNEVESYNLTTALEDENEKDITLTLNDGADPPVPAMIYTLKGCSFDSESFTSSIGANKSVDMTFTTSVGGPSDTNHGIFVSGISTGALYTGVHPELEPTD
jgi:hypothetical protein